MSTLVLGLGNPILSDDGVGIHVVRQAAAQHNPVHSDEVTFVEASAGGLRLLEVIAGCERLILVDAIQTVGGASGQCHRLRVENGVLRQALDGSQGLSKEVHAPLHAGSTHDLSFVGALAFGRDIGMALPTDANISILAVEVEDVLTFGESLTPAVAAALPKVVGELLDELNKRLGERGTP